MSSSGNSPFMWSGEQTAKDGPFGGCASLVSLSVFPWSLDEPSYGNRLAYSGPPQRLMRWYNPTLEDFEWREVPESDEEALSVLEGSPACTKTYREWRALGAGIMAALIRAGEAAKEESEW
jgi:hypothetical protein